MIVEDEIIDTSAQNAPDSVVSLNTDKPVITKKEGEYTETDIFAWTNNLVQYVDELKIDLYFFNKNYIVYKVKLTGDVSKQLRGIFIDNIFEYIFDGLEKGLVVRDFEDAESEDGVLQKTKVKNVEKLVYTKNWIEKELSNIENFEDAEHDIKRMKGVIAYCRHESMPAPFYVIKALPSSQVMKGQTSWLIKDNKFTAFTEDMSVMKIPAENQLLVVGDDLFVFNQTRLKGLFGYDAKLAAIAKAKIAEIETKFKLTFEEGESLEKLALGKPSTIKKLQKLELDLVNQNDLIAHAEEMGVDIMTDDNGAIIIMDDKDMVKFVNLMNDDYMESPMTGLRYEIISKKPLVIKDDKDL